MKIVNANNLKVKQLGKDKYLTWTSTIYILFVPKVIFELDNNGKVKNTDVVGFAKSILLNFSFIIGILLVYLYIENKNLYQITEFTPLFIGILVVLILNNFILIRATKRIVKKQIE